MIHSSRSLAAGYDFLIDQWFVTPAISFSGLNVREDGFKESDMGQPVIHADSRSNSYYSSNLGVA